MGVRRIFAVPVLVLFAAGAATPAAADGRADIQALLSAPGVIEAILDGAADATQQQPRKLQEWERQLLAARVWLDIDRKRLDPRIDVVLTGSISD